MLRGFHALVREVAGYAVPIAAVVEGRCLGGAFELVLACHFVFATETAVFGCPEIKLGVIPPVLAAIGRHRLGPLAERLLLTGRELGHARRARTVRSKRRSDGSDPRAFVLEWYRANLAPLSALALREATRAGREASGLVASLGAPLDAARARLIERLLPEPRRERGDRGIPREARASLGGRLSREATHRARHHPRTAAAAASRATASTECRCATSRAPPGWGSRASTRTSARRKTSCSRFTSRRSTRSSPAPAARSLRASDTTERLHAFVLNHVPLFRGRTVT